jgi:small subunit ribosomal protein S17
MSEDIKNLKIVVGEVVSNKMEKTITLKVERQVMHPLYKKYVKKTSKLMAHDESSECAIGDTVAVEACRPLSKNKTWRVQKVITKATQI